MSKARSKWWYEKDGRKQGPFRNREIRQLVQSRAVTADDLLVHEKAGRLTQVVAGDIPGLFRSVRTSRTGQTLRSALAAITVGLLLACLLNPWSEVTAQLNGVLHMVCVTLSLAGAGTAVLAPLLCAIRLPGTFDRVPINAVLQAELGQDEDDPYPSSLAGSEPDAGVTGEMQPIGYDAGWMQKYSLTAKLVAAWWHFAPIICGVAACLAVSALLGSYLMRSAEPFRYRPVSGKVTYADGTVLPVEDLYVIFYPQKKATDARIRPRAGRAVIDGKTGAFSSVTSRKAKDGLLKGLHKVTLHLPEGVSGISGGVFGSEYSDIARTPLSIDVTHAPLLIKIEKPKEDLKDTKSVLGK